MMPVQSSRSPLISRRDALSLLAGAGVATAASPVLGFPDGWFQAAEEPLPFTDMPPELSTRRPNAPPDAPPFLQDLRHLRSWITPNDEFFAVAHYGTPEVDASSWRLRVDGRVASPVVLTLEELKRRPRVERTVTFECSGNQARRFHGMVGNATWAGASLKDLLAQARPGTDAIEVIYWAADRGTEKIRDGEYQQNFARAMSLDDAMVADAIIAYEMNGEPLPVAHGFPTRLIVPGWYGISNVKWLERIELSPRRLMNRFMGRDYVTIMGRRTEGGIEWVETSVTRQQIKSVVARVSRAGDRLKVFGVAWTDGTPLKTVEIRLDAGAWQPARLDPQPNPYAWTFFTLEGAMPPPGEHTVVSRATDARGRVQPESLELKKTYWEDNAQFRRTFSVT